MSILIDASLGLLVYFTAGFAYGGIKNEANFPGIANYVRSTTATGYAVDGGWEYKFSAAWSAKIEYQCVNLGGNSFKLKWNGAPCAPAMTMKLRAV